MSKHNPFDFINDITIGKTGNLLDENEDVYPAWMVNKGLSYFEDTIHLANIMNEFPNLDKKMQYDFLLNTVSKRKRFAKWFKAEKVEDIQNISEFYKISVKKAEALFPLLNDEQLNIIRKKLEKGGRMKRG